MLRQFWKDSGRIHVGGASLLGCLLLLSRGSVANSRRCAVIVPVASQVTCAGSNCMALRDTEDGVDVGGPVH